VNDSLLPQVESIKKRAQALKVAKQVRPPPPPSPHTPHPRLRLVGANAYMRARVQLPHTPNWR
jgi:hypothetical protein